MLLEMIWCDNISCKKTNKKHPPRTKQAAKLKDSPTYYIHVSYGRTPLVMLVLDQIAYPVFVKPHLFQSFSWPVSWPDIWSSTYIFLCLLFILLAKPYRLKLLFIWSMSFLLQCNFGMASYISFHFFNHRGSCIMHYIEMSGIIINKNET